MLISDITSAVDLYLSQRQIRISERIRKRNLLKHKLIIMLSLNSSQS